MIHPTVGPTQGIYVLGSRSLGIEFRIHLVLSVSVGVPSVSVGVVTPVYFCVVPSVGMVKARH